MHGAFSTVSMAGKDFIDGQLCVARVNPQPLLQCLKEREDLAGGQLEAGLLSTEDVGSLASSGPGCVGVVVMRDIHWRPKTLEQQYLRSSKAALLCHLPFCYQLTFSDEIAACGMCP